MFARTHSLWSLSCRNCCITFSESERIASSNTYDYVRSHPYCDRPVGSMNSIKRVECQAQLHQCNWIWQTKTSRSRTLCSVWACVEWDLECKSVGDILLFGPCSLHLLYIRTHADFSQVSSTLTSMSFGMDGHWCMWAKSQVMCMYTHANDAPDRVFGALSIAPPRS